MPFHVNADFFLVSDRKRLAVEDYQGKWNRRALEAAARILEQRLVELRDVCGHRELWSLVADAHHIAISPAARERGLSLESFWQVLEPTLKSSPVLWTNTDTWATPAGAYIVKEPEEIEVAEVLAGLEVVFTHPELREYCLRLPSLGLTQLSIVTLVDILLSCGLDERLELHDLPSVLQEGANRQLLLGEVERLINRAPLEARRACQRTLFGSATLQRNSTWRRRWLG